MSAANNADGPTEAEAVRRGDPANGGISDETVPGTGSAGAANAANLPQHVIAGYEILGEISRGGQGVVYLAIQKATRRKVAIKVIREGPFHGEREKARFEREVHILAQLKHPSIVTIHDSGIAVGCCFFVMDYISGQSLSEFMRSRGRGLSSPGADPPRRMPVDDVLRLFARICDAVHAAHLRGIIHRDLKPDNIRIDADGLPHILDFGLARTLAAESGDNPGADAVTFTGQFMGSLRWASPEQAEAIPEKVDIRTDVYSLGMILYEMLTGQAPYPVTGSARDVLNNILLAQPLRPRLIARDVNDEVETIVLRCLAKDRDRRYQSAGDLSRDIQRYLMAEPIEAKRDSTFYVLRKHFQRHWPAVTAAAGALSLVFALAILMSIQARRERSAKEDAVKARDEARRATTQAIAARDEAREAQRAALVQKKLAENRAEALRRSDYARAIHEAAEAARTNDIQRMNDALNRCPQDLRGWEWDRLRWMSDRSRWTLANLYAASAPSGREFWLSETPRVEFSADSTRVVVIVKYGQVRILDAATGATLVTVRSPAELVRCVALSPDGLRLATGGSKGTIRLWDALSGAPLSTPAAWTAHRARIPLLSSSAVHALAFSPDGATIASGGSDGEIRLWEAATGTQRQALPVGGAVQSIRFNAAGDRIVCTTEENGYAAWKIGRSAPLLYLDQPSSYERVSLGVTPDWIAERAGGVIRVLSVASGECVTEIPLRDPGVTTVAISENGRRVATSFNTTWRLWDVATARELRTGNVNTAIRWLGLTPDGSRMVVDEGSSIRVLLGSQDHALPGHAQPAAHLTLSPDSSGLITVDQGGTLKCWDLRETDAGSQIALPGSWIHTLHFGSDDHQILGGISGAFSAGIRVWDARTGVDLRSFCDTVDSNFLSRGTVLPSPDGRCLAVGTREGGVWLWDCESGRRMTVRAPHNVFPFGDEKFLAFDSASRSLAIAPTRAGRIEILNSSNGLLEQTLGNKETGPIAISRDGDSLASVTPNMGLTIWEIKSGRPRRTLPIPNPQRPNVTFLLFSGDGSRLLAGFGDGRLRLWDLQSGDLRGTPAGHDGKALCAAFIPDGRRFASGGSDARIRIWDADTCEELLVLQGQRTSITSLAFSHDGTRLASTAQGGAAWIWETMHPTPELHAQRRAIESARRVVERLTSEMGLCSDVVRRLESDPAMPEEPRRLALRIARAQTDRPELLCELARPLLRNASAAPADHARAMTWAQAACRLSPTHYVPHIVLGMAQYRSEQFDAAIVEFERAAQATPVLLRNHVADLESFRAMALFRAGHRGEAVRILNDLSEARSSDLVPAYLDCPECVAEAAALIGAGASSPSTGRAN